MQEDCHLRYIGEPFFRLRKVILVGMFMPILADVERSSDKELSGGFEKIARLSLYRTRSSTCMNNHLALSALALAEQSAAHSWISGMRCLAQKYFQQCLHLKGRNSSFPQYVHFTTFTSNSRCSSASLTI